MTTRETIQKAIGILKTVKKKSEYDIMQDWYLNSGYDGDFDKKMKGYFSTINILSNQELHQTMCDVWNATLEFYYTGPRTEECEIEKAISEEQRVKKSITAEDKARGVVNFQKVHTNKGERVLITYRDGSKILRKLWEAPKPEQMLNFDACEKELIDLAELGSHDYRSALAKLVEKYRA